MAKHCIMDHTGHTVVEFDKADPAALKEAQARFDKLVAEHHTAAVRNVGERDYTLVKAFDPTADETIFALPKRGG